MHIHVINYTIIETEPIVLLRFCWSLDAKQNTEMSGLLDQTK